MFSDPDNQPPISPLSRLAVLQPDKGKKPASVGYTVWSGDAFSMYGGARKRSNPATGKRQMPRDWWITPGRMKRIKNPNNVAKARTINAETLPEIKKLYARWAKEHWRTRQQKIQTMEEVLQWAIEEGPRKGLLKSDIKSVKKALKKLTRAVKQKEWEKKRKQERVLEREEWAARRREMGDEKRQVQEQFQQTLAERRRQEQEQLEEVEEEIQEELKRDLTPTPGLEMPEYSKPVDFTEETVDTLRDEFLMLMKNLKKVNTPEIAEELRGYLFQWASDFKRLYTEPLVEDLKTLKDDMHRDAMRQGFPPRIATRVFEQFENELWQVSGALTGEIKDFPYRLSDKARYGARYAFNNFQEDRKAWERKTRKKARECWKGFKYYISWRNRGAAHGGADKPIQFNTRSVMPYPLEGFNTSLLGFEDTPKFQDKLERVRVGLTAFENRLGEVWPEMVRHAKNLDIKLDFNYFGSTGGEYTHGKGITLYPRSDLTKDSYRQMFNVIAHEFGHYIHAKILSGEQRAAWAKVLKEDRVSLDLREVLAEWPEDVEDYLIDLQKHLKTVNPTLYHQLDSLNYGEAENWDIRTRRDMEDFVNDGHPYIPVQQNPISGYATVNDNEAFAELVGNLVAYGPRSLPPIAQRWVTTLFPRMRFASEKPSASRVASTWLHDNIGNPNFSRDS